MPSQPKDFPIWEPISDERMERLVEDFHEIFNHIARKLGLDLEKFSISQPVVYEIIERVEMRRVYFHIFHKDMRNMGEANECALYCFWILKLMPFHYASGVAKGNINQVMSMYFLTSILQWIADKEGKTLQVTAKKHENLFYALCYRDLSKEALMALAETLIC
jgi:hypothetical protein